MKLTPSLIASLAALLPLAAADFSVYAVGLSDGGLAGPVDGWQVYGLTDEKVSCDKVRGWIWQDSDDVSGGKYGVRCEGENGGCVRGGGGGGGIKQWEMNTGNGPHFTYYRGRNGALVNLKDDKIGTCTPAPGGTFSCGLNVGRAEGQRKLNCKSRWSAAEINAARL